MKTPQSLRSGHIADTDPEKRRFPAARVQEPESIRAPEWAHAALPLEYGLILAFAASAFESLVRTSEKH
jgi:hypothetical protein